MASYSNVRVEGGLLSPDFLEMIHEAGGQKPADFELAGRRSLVDEVSAAWADARAYRAALQRRLERARDNESVTTITREQWVIPLLESLGYRLTFQRRAAEAGDRTYPISHRAGDEENGPPVHIVAFNQPLGERPASGRGQFSPHALMQEYLNRTDEQVWGLVTNGAIFRLLRDSTYFTRPAYIEFDLEQMLRDERLDDFFLFYRLAHRSRLPGLETAPADCWLERYYQQAQEQGGRIRDGLRRAVADAILTLGNGFLHHPRNNELRSQVQAGRLSADTFYQQLLYLIYRFLFLMVSEERNLLELDRRGGSRTARTQGSRTAPTQAVGYYREHLSIGRLRQLADAPLNAPERFDDLYLGVRTLFYVLEGRRESEVAGLLELPTLNGELFAELPDLDNATLNNRDLLSAIRSLSYFIPAGERVRRRVNYAALDVEELGSVYESLLDEQPIFEGLDVGTGGVGRGGVGTGGSRTAPTLHFAFVSGTTRKTTGSYYTPRELVNEVIKSALEPVIAERLQAAGSDRDARIAALLALRVCDPACGSGHFLLAAARRIGRELARAQTGHDEPAPDVVREATRQAITHCIYGVDKNPLAVDLCKVALWIEGHSRGKPLTFLDYHIRRGDSLVGLMDLAVLDEGIPDAAYDPVSGDDKAVAATVKKQNKAERQGQMSLFGRANATQPAASDPGWQNLLDLPEDTPAQVRRKQQLHRQLQEKDGETRVAANLWTAAFFSHLTARNLTERAIATSDMLRQYRANPKSVDGRPVGAAEALAAELDFFHWPLEFRHVFEKGGFDVVLGNPPWERIKLQEQEFFASRDYRIANADTKAEREKLINQLRKDSPLLWQNYRDALHYTEELSKFLRQCQRFTLSAHGDINTYAIFTELARNLVNKAGRAGLIVPTGLVATNTYQEFFSDLVESNDLVSFMGFINSRKIFPAIKDYIQFALLTLGRASIAEFAFLLTEVSQLNEPIRKFSLTKEEFSLLNPNTRTCSIFRTRADADLTKKIYQRIPVLINEVSKVNLWKARFATMFHMSNDSSLFNTRSQLEQAGYGLSSNRFERGDEHYLPLYEAKMIYQFNHRFGTYENASQANVNEGNLPQLTLEMLSDPYCAAIPKYWVSASDVSTRSANFTAKRWLICFRDVTGGASERTGIFAVLPHVGIGNSASILLVEGQTTDHLLCLLTNLNSIVFDYVTRQKIASAHMNFFIVKQLPTLPPSIYRKPEILFIVPRALELVYTAWDLSPFAQDMWQEADEPLRQAIRAQWAANHQATGGHPPQDVQPPPYDNLEHLEHLEHVAPRHPPTPLTHHASPITPPFPPFKWDDTRRAQLRADLDAYYARLYGLSRDELRYILDPADIYGPDFPGETFRVLREKEIKQHGEYRSQRLVLAAWDEQQRAIDRGEMQVSTPTAVAVPVMPTAVTIQTKPAAATAPQPAPTRAKAAGRPATPPAATTSPPPLRLPDQAIASRGPFGERFKRVQQLAGDGSAQATAELVVFLAAPENSIQWVAKAALEQRGNGAIAALSAYVQEGRDAAGRRAAEGILAKIRGNLGKEKG